MDAHKSGGASRLGVVSLPRLGPYIHRGPVIEGKKGPQAVGMVVVSVGQSRQFYPIQVHPQLLGIVRKPAGGARIQQKAPAPVLQEEGQAVLRLQPLPGRIFHQDRDPQFRCHPAPLLYSLFVFFCV